MLEIQQYKEMKKIRDDWNTTDKLKYTQKQWEEFEDITYLLHIRFLFEYRVQERELGFGNKYSKEELEHTYTVEKLINEMKSKRENNKLAFECSYKYKYDKLILSGWENYNRQHINIANKSESKRIDNSTEERRKKEKLLMLARVQKKIGCKLTIENFLKVPEEIRNSLTSEEKEFVYNYTCKIGRE